MARDSLPHTDSCVKRDLALVAEVAEKMQTARQRISPKKEVSIHMRRFTFKIGYIWQGVIFGDGSVCIRGKAIGQSLVETYRYCDLDEMLDDIGIDRDNIEWIDKEGSE